MEPDFNKTQKTVRILTILLMCAAFILCYHTANDTFSSLMLVVCALIIASYLLVTALQSKKESVRKAFRWSAVILAVSALFPLAVTIIAMAGRTELNKDYRLNAIAQFVLLMAVLSVQAFLITYILLNKENQSNESCQTKISSNPKNGAGSPSSRQRTTGGKTPAGTARSGYQDRRSRSRTNVSTHHAHQAAERTEDGAISLSRTSPSNRDNLSEMSEDYEALKEYRRQEREKKESVRWDYALKALEEKGYTVEQDPEGRCLQFQHNGNTVTVWPYTGWFAGKSVQDGRGIKNLLKQL